VVARIKNDITIGVGDALLAKIDAWAAYFNRPRSEYVRLILERSHKNKGYPEVVQPAEHSPQPEAVTAEPVMTMAPANISSGE
jgi:hypothetical protein